MKEKLSKNTIAYCITAIICVLILAFAYLKANRYTPAGTTYTIDQWTGKKVYLIHDR